MADYLTNTTDLTLVADAIRAKGGTSEQLAYPDGFVSAIQNIPTGSSKPEQSKSIVIESNTTTVITPDDGYTLDSVSVTTNVPSSVSGISGEHIGSYTVNDGILVFTVPQEDYQNYNNFYIKKQGVSFGLFVLNIVVNPTSAKIWYALHDSSATPQVATSYVSVEQSSVNYEFTVNLSESGGAYYSGGVDVYVITA